MTDKPRPDAEEREPVTDEATEAAENDVVDETEDRTPDPGSEDDAPDNVVELDEAARLQQELDEHRDRLLRTVAEMENLRKRTRREVMESRRFAQADLLRPLLEVLDNFERALDHAPDEDSAQTFHEGVAMIAQNFRQVLTERGVKVIEAEGEEFDPALHEAVGQAPANDDVPAGSVLAVVQNGYTLDDMVLRASRVIVAQ